MFQVIIMILELSVNSTGNIGERVLDQMFRINRDILVNGNERVTKFISWCLVTGRTPEDDNLITSFKLYILPSVPSSRYIKYKIYKFLEV